MRTPEARRGSERGCSEGRKTESEFELSRDVREDRGERQMKIGAAPRTQRGK